MLQEQYETHYRIYNHDAQYVPALTFVTMQPMERYLPYSRYRRLLDNYATYGIWDLYHLNVLEFLNQTRVEVEQMLELAVEHKRRKDRRHLAEDKAAREMVREANSS